MITVYEVWRNSDVIEGKGPMVKERTFKFEEDAVQFAKGLGPMGMSDGDVREVYVLESIDEVPLADKEYLRKSALKKLTEAEIEALGLNTKQEQRKIPWP